ncbi:TPA: hypothetical protein IBV55_003449 [Escherichia coli]|nr:hypothetical protein [Escherichia coli]
MPITLEPWQLFVICCAFGWVNKGSRLRRFREVYTEIPRKNGKSAISAGVALYCFACDNEFGAEVYSGATTEKQAWEVFRPARLMCKRTPMLTEAFGIEVNASNMNRPEDGARFEPLIGNPGDGSSPHCAVVDEYHEHATDALYTTMLTGMGARRQPLMWAITTAGYNIEGPCYDKRREVIEMLNGSVDTKTAQKDKFGAGKNGFTRGNPQTGTPATDLDDDYFDMLQEELCSVVEASGASLEKGRHDQLLTALRALLLSRKNPFGDIKSDGTVKIALENLGLGEGSPAIGVPFFWPSAAMPNTVIDSWSSMVFLKFNGAKFSATDYPVLAKVFPSLVLPEARGDFIRIWDDGRGADGGRELLSWQAATNFSQFAGNIGEGAGHAINFHDGIAGNQPGFSRFNFTSNSVGDGVNFVAVRPRNIAFNFLVRAK